VSRKTAATRCLAILLFLTSEYLSRITWTAIAVAACSVLLRDNCDKSLYKHRLSVLPVYLNFIYRVIYDYIAAVSSDRLLFVS